MVLVRTHEMLGLKTWVVDGGEVGLGSTWVDGIGIFEREVSIANKDLARLPFASPAGWQSSSVRTSSLDGIVFLR